MRFILLLFSFLLFSACSNQTDIGFVYHNVNGYTLMNSELHQFEALAVVDGKILATGTNEEILDAFSDFAQFNGNGNTLLPGLIDAHAHVMGLGIQELDVNVAGIESLDETLQVIEAFAADHPDREWITGRGWNQVLWEENEFPTASDLDEVVSGRPVFLTRIDGHAGWANSRAMELAGIDQTTEDPTGGRIIRNDNGEATGVFIDSAMNLIETSIPEITQEDRKEALRLAMEEMSKHGLTSVHDAGIDQKTWNLYTQTADNDELITRIYAMISGTGNTFDALSDNGPINSYADDMLALRSVKLYSDGALGSRGAAMLDDYSDDPGNRGLLFHNQEEMNQMLMKGATQGYQMNVHAIGDAGNRQVLDGFEYLENERGDQENFRHRIEHAQVVDLEDIPRFEELNLIASMQPTHATSDMNMAEDRVGSERIQGAYAWQEFLNQGTVIAAGSDFPVEDVNPFYGLYSAVTRKDHGGMPPGGWYSEQSLSRIEALRAFTIDAAYAAHQDHLIGTLEPGKWADFIVIDRDFFEVPASEIWQTEVLETWIAGEKVYQKEN
ncbi:amidohydrolase [Rhodohalobacter sulfatireducens]|uniref:Amidohydrolase n=1 Tax=Rhodohalobacter sulfatireducens TaxID=2911366 RepID=A0ABS9KE93_9BACT|nr:amidohydrolase [Rhodohalobacter sulfatireducens]MCG2589174.1 amidohydrolase [Rhodohalobacter sulfatireducens]